MKLRIIHNEEDDYYLIQKKWLWYWETCDYVWNDGDLSFNATSSKDGKQFKSLDGCNILVERYIKYHSSIKTKVIKEYNTNKTVITEDISHLLDELRTTELGSEREKELLIKLKLI